MFRPSVFAVARLKQRVPTGSTARLGDRQASRHGGSYPRTRPSNAAGRPLMMVRARIVVFRNPICFIKYCKVSGPGQARLFRRVVAASSPACRSTAAAIATVYGVSPSQNAEEHPAPRDEHTLERLTSCSPARWSGKNGTPCWHSATSNDASGKGMASALPSTQVTGVPGRAWKRSRHSQHPRVEIQAGDLTCRADLLRREPRHHSSAAGHVQHALSRAKVGQLDEVRVPRAAGEGTQHPIQRLRIDPERRGKFAATFRTVVEEVCNAKRRCHINQLRDQRPSQKLTQSWCVRSLLCLLRPVLGDHGISVPLA